MRLSRLQVERTASSLSDGSDGRGYLFTGLQPIQDLILIISTFLSFGEDRRTRLTSSRPQHRNRCRYGGTRMA